MVERVALPSAVPCVVLDSLAHPPVPASEAGVAAHVGAAPPPSPLPISAGIGLGRGAIWRRWSLESSCKLTVTHVGANGGLTGWIGFANLTLGSGGGGGSCGGGGRACASADGISVRTRSSSVLVVGTSTMRLRGGRTTGASRISSSPRLGCSPPAWRLSRAACTAAVIVSCRALCSVCALVSIAQHSNLANTNAMATSGSRVRASAMLSFPFLVLPLEVVMSQQLLPSGLPGRQWCVARGKEDIGIVVRPQIELEGGMLQVTSPRL
jgi:hypothetical protein